MDRVAVALTQALDAPVLVHWTRAAKTPVRMTRTGPARSPDGFELWLHRAFREASEEVLLDLAAWLRHGRRSKAACQRLDRFLHDCVRPHRHRPVPRPAGCHHDLDAISRGLLAGPLLPAPTGGTPDVTWSVRRRSSARRSLQLGSYDPDLTLIRIHWALDSAEVPAWLVETVLHHEWLHALLPHERSATGQHLHHGPLFRSWEARHPRSRDALAWEREHLFDLMKCARSGLAFSVRGTQGAQ